MNRSRSSLLIALLCSTGCFVAHSPEASSRNDEVVPPKVVPPLVLASHCAAPTAPLLRIEHVDANSVKAGPCGHVTYNTTDSALWLRKGDGATVELVAAPPTPSGGQGVGRALSFDVLGDYLSYSVGGLNGSALVLYDIRMGKAFPLGVSPYVHDGFVYDASIHASVPFQWPSTLGVVPTAGDAGKVTLKWGPSLSKTLELDGDYRAHASSASIVVGRRDDGHIVSVDLSTGAARTWPVVVAQKDLLWLSDDGELLIVQTPTEACSGDYCVQGATFSGAYQTRTIAPVADPQLALSRLTLLGDLQIEERGGTVAFFRRGNLGLVAAVDTAAGRALTLKSNTAAGQEDSYRHISLLADGRLAAAHGWNGASTLEYITVASGTRERIAGLSGGRAVSAVSRDGTHYLTEQANAATRGCELWSRARAEHVGDYEGQCLFWGNANVVVADAIRGRARIYSPDGVVTNDRDIFGDNGTAFDLFPFATGLLLHAQGRRFQAAYYNELHAFAPGSAAPQEVNVPLKPQEHLRSVPTTCGDPLLFTGIAWSKGSEALVHGRTRVAVFP